MLAESFKVQRGAVALVLRKSVFREFAVEVEHESIARDFCNDTRCGDRKAQGVSTDERGLFDGKLPYRQPVDQHMIGCRGKLRSRGAHRLMGGAKNVQLVDLAMGDDGDGPMHIRPGEQFLVKALALNRAELLRVAQDIVMVITWQNDRGGDYGAGEGSAAGFIDSRYKRKASSTESVLVLEAAIHRR